MDAASATSIRRSHVIRTDSRGASPGLALPLRRSRARRPLSHGDASSRAAPLVPFVTDSAAYGPLVPPDSGSGGAPGVLDGGLQGLPLPRPGCRRRFPPLLALGHERRGFHAAPFVPSSPGVMIDGSPLPARAPERMVPARCPLGLLLSESGSFPGFERSDEGVSRVVKDRRLQLRVAACGVPGDPGAPTAEGLVPIVMSAD